LLNLSLYGLHTDSLVTMNIKHLFAGILVLVPFAFAAWVYPSLPPTIPIHFNMEGKADAWGSRDSVFIGPLILGFVSILVYLLMANIRKIDPKRYEGADDKVYAQFGLFMVAFLAVLSLVIILSSVNQNIPVEQLVFGIMGFAFAIMGIFMPRLKQNYMAGYRLPWTLEDEQNWEYTHSLAGKYWLYGGLLQGIIAILLQGKWIFITFMLILVVMILGPLIHSFTFFKKHKKA
jgi:uncharacterized membrane protein